MTCCYEFQSQGAMFNCHIRLPKRVQLSQLTGNQWQEAFEMLQEIETQRLGRKWGAIHSTDRDKATVQHGDEPWFYKKRPLMILPSLIIHHVWATVL